MAVNHPRIVVILSDTNQQIFIVCEQQILCEVVSIEMALFITFGTYYTFNLQYPKEINGMLTFIQDNILEAPDSTKRSATYLSTTTDIRYYVN